MRFMSLASGSNGNCYYIETEGAAVIIDAGIGGRTIKKRLSTAGVDMNGVMAVLVTHDHSDHTEKRDHSSDNGRDIADYIGQCSADHRADAADVRIHPGD
ncbi:MAG: MBL fold metallo-hydrolase, partial [Paludibacteraceae bacterium]|nr:MBL fold metallo-hydrolase [Paludibacteraceae bacterium]